MLLWIGIYVAVLLGPILVLTVWDGVRLLRRRRARRQGTEPKITAEAPIQRSRRAEALEGRWIAIRAQFVVAPHQAVEEAEAFLRSISPEAAGQPIPTPSTVIPAPAAAMVRLQGEFERVLSRR